MNFGDPIRRPPDARAIIRSLARRYADEYAHCLGGTPAATDWAAGFYRGKMCACLCALRDALYDAPDNVRREAGAAMRQTFAAARLMKRLNRRAAARTMAAVTA